MIYDIHLILPDATEFDNMSKPLQAQLNALDTRWPSFPGIGTKSYQSKKLIHARLQHPDLTKATLEALISAFSLDWEVIGIREAVKIPAVYDNEGNETQAAYFSVIEPINKATILPYLNDIVEIDENQNTTTRAPTLADTIYLPMYAGVDPIKLN